MTTFEEVLRKASAMTESDRARLIETLLQGLDADQAAPLQDTWLAEIERRSAELDAGVVQGIPWETVRANARQKVFGHA